MCLQGVTEVYKRSEATALLCFLCSLKVGFHHLHNIFKKGKNMEYLNKFLSCIEKDSKLFKNSDLNFILGLTNTQIKDLKKHTVSNKLIKEEKKEFFLTEQGKKYLLENPVKSWCNIEFPKRPEINLEYLKLEKMPPTLTKAIRCLARHLLEKEELKNNSTESYLMREILSDNSTCKNLREEMEQYILQGQKLKLTDLFEKFISYGLTKSITAILLLDVLAKNKNILAIYEKLHFQLKLDQLMFDRMIFCPQNFEIQKTIMDDLPILEKISLVLSENPTKNILDITKTLIYFIKKLEKYTLNTERLTKKTLRFRNVIMNAKDPISLFNRDIPKVLYGKMLYECDDEFVKLYQSSIEELKNTTGNMIDEINKFFFESFSAKTRQSLAKRFKAVEEFIGEKELKILFNNIIEKDADDILWINRIATFINKSRVPKDWSDEDVADFKIKVKDLSLKFYTLEATIGTTTKGISKNFEKVLNCLLSLSKAEQNVILQQFILRTA